MTEVPVLLRGRQIRRPPRVGECFLARSEAASIVLAVADTDVSVMSFIDNVLTYVLPDVDAVLESRTPETLARLLLEPPIIFAREIWTGGYVSRLDGSLPAEAMMTEHYFVMSNGKVCDLNGTLRPEGSPQRLGLNRPEIDGGAEATGEWSSASTQEVPPGPA